MSTLALLLIIAGAVLVVLFVGGWIAARRRQPSDWAEHVAAADQALQEARAADKGWDREVLERTARDALERERPGWTFRDLHLVLVDDRPGVADDRAHLVAVGEDEEVRLVLKRSPAGEWSLESIG